MRGELLCLILVLLIPLSGAVKIHLEQQNVRDCPAGFDAAAVLRNATLYSQVYDWMHQRDVTDWSYTTFLNATDCALVSYKTEVESPSIFARLMRSLHMFVHFPIEVLKSVCVIDGTVEETATITIPLIHEMTMTTRYSVHENVINSTIDASYNIPWYVDFLVLDVSEHLLANFKEKLDAVARSLCAPAPPLLGLGIPEHAYLRKHQHPHGPHGPHGPHHPEKPP